MRGGGGRLTLELCGLPLAAGPLERSVRRGVTTTAPHVEAGATEHAGAIEKTACSASWHLAPAVLGGATRLTRRAKRAGTGCRSRDG